jgi:hypothetical protein
MANNLGAHMKSDLCFENDIFTSQQDGRVMILTLKTNPLYRIAEKETKETLKLMNFSVSELESCLEKENQLIYRLVRTSSFYDKLSAAYNDI